jgi:MinD-like ATPase involved in chromosome partitioning or flagellar assembly
VEWRERTGSSCIRRSIKVVYFLNSYKGWRNMDDRLIPGLHNQIVKICLIEKSAKYREDIVSYYQKHNQEIEVIYAGDSVEMLLSIDPSSINVLLINRDLIEEIPEGLIFLKSKGFRKIILIVDELIPIPDILDDDKSIHILYKYTPYSLITQKILSLKFDFNEKLLETAQRELTHSLNKVRKVVFYSPKGGVGKTTLAINSALQLVLKNKKVLLVDFSIFGSISAALNLPRNKSLAETIGILEQQTYHSEALEKAILDSIIEIEIQHEKKLYVLAAASYIKMGNLTLEMTDKILEVLEKFDFEAIICDTSTELTHKNISLLSWATDVFLITMPDIVVNWQLLSARELLQKLKHPYQSHYLIVNKYNPSYSISSKEIEAVLSMHVDEVIPDFDLQIQNFVNRGALLVHKSQLKVQRHFRRVAHLIFPIFNNKEIGKLSLFSFMGRKK